MDLKLEARRRMYTVPQVSFLGASNPKQDSGPQLAVDMNDMTASQELSYFLRLPSRACLG